MLQAPNLWSGRADVLIRFRGRADVPSACGTGRLLKETGQGALCLAFSGVRARRAPPSRIAHKVPSPIPVDSARRHRSFRTICRTILRGILRHRTKYGLR